MKTYNPTEPTPESDIIRADIEQTRESMDHTLDEIGAKMKPRHLFDEVLGYFRNEDGDGGKLKECAGAAFHSAGETAERATHAIGDVVRRHPIPALLIGAGLAYAIYESRQGSRGNGGSKRSHANEASFDELEQSEFESTSHGIKEQAAEGMHSVKEKAKSAVTSAGEQIQEKGRKLREHATEGMHAIGEKASHLKDKVIEKTHRGYEVSRAKFVQTRQEHPLPVGLGFLAAGILVGLVLPPSRKEDEWVGSASDRVKDRAKAKGEDLVERGKHVVVAAAGAAKKSAEVEGLTPEALLQKAEHVASATEQAAKRSAELTPSAPDDLGDAK